MGPMVRPSATVLPAPGRATGVWIFVGLVAALAAFGGVLALRAIERGGPQPSAKPYPPTKAVPLPFGSMVVERVDKFAEAAPVGTPGRWRPGSSASLAQVQVSVQVALSNETTRPVHLAAGQFALIVRNSTSRLLAPVATSAGGDLPPGSVLPVSVKFDAPRTGRLLFQFRAPGSSRPALIDLGTASTRARLGPGVQVLARGHLH